MDLLSGLHHILLVAYVATLMGCTLIGLLISMFYRQKFHQPSPRLGFVVCLLFGAAFIVTHVYALGREHAALHVLRIYLLLACGMTGVWGFLGLHFILKKVRK